MPDRPELAEFASRIRQGDRMAEEELVHQFRSRVRAFLESRTHDHGLVDDVCQEVFLSVLCALRAGEVRQVESLGSYIYGTARNLLMDRLRRGARESPLEIDVAGIPPDYEERERHHLARKAISTLDPLDRQILLLTLVDGCRPAEIVEKLALSSDVVRQRKSRALKKVAEIVKGLSRTVAPMLPMNRKVD